MARRGSHTTSFKRAVFYPVFRSLRVVFFSFRHAGSRLPRTRATHLFRDPFQDAYGDVANLPSGLFHSGGVTR